MKTRRSNSDAANNGMRKERPQLPHVKLSWHTIGSVQFHTFWDSRDFVVDVWIPDTLFPPVGGGK